MVRKLAAEAGIDLATVKATGVGGRIRADDVRAAARQRNPAPSPAVALATAVPRPHLVLEVRSRWPSFGHLKIDAFSTNPLVDEIRQGSKITYDNAIELAPAPTLFPSGDLPLFTASGIQPELLLVLPAIVRHLAAACDQSRAAELFATCGGGDHASVYQAQMLAEKGDQPGWSAYVGRVETWRTATPPQPEYGIVYLDPHKQPGPGRTSTSASPLPENLW